MMYALSLILLLSSLGCSVSVDPKPIKVEPITVTHNIKVDPSLLRAYFTDICKKDITLITDQEISDCIAKKTDEFLNGLSYSGSI